MSTELRPLRTPPGPSGPLALHEVRADPLRFLGDLAARYGDIVRYTTGGLTATLLNRPEYARHALQKAAANYTKIGTPDLRLLEPMLGEALMTSEGEAWRRQRTMLQPAFTRRSVERYAELMTRATEEMVARWEARSQPCAPVEVVDEMNHLTLRIAARALFAYDVSEQSDEFAEAVRALNETMGHPHPGDREVVDRFIAGRTTVRAVVDDVIARQAAGDAETDDAAMTLLLRPYFDAADESLDRLELRDQVLTFLLAGHETTAKSLSWILYLLSCHPEWRKRVRAEAGGSRMLPGASEIAAMTTLEAVVQESLRLYPPVWIISRIAVEADEIDGFEIPAGSLICVSPYLLHRNSAVWPRADTFDPERFLRDRSQHWHDGLMPFSAGPRHCIGRRFADLELKLVVATLVRRCDLDLVSGHPVEPEALVTMRPRWGLPMAPVPVGGASA